MEVTALVATTPDAVVIQASWSDSDRFATLYDRYAAQLYRYAYRRVGGQVAEDVVADTFLAAFRRRRSYDLNRPDARPWLFGILTKELARHERTERTRWRTVARSAPEVAVDGPAEQVAERVSAGGARVPLAAALADLSSGDRDVLPHRLGRPQLRRGGGGAEGPGRDRPITTAPGPAQGARGPRRNRPIP
jgi:DNA-directed RNA polymerase specialized sigma24 family protein